VPQDGPSPGRPQTVLFYPALSSQGSKDGTHHYNSNPVLPSYYQQAGKTKKIQTDEKHSEIQQNFAELNKYLFDQIDIARNGVQQNKGTE